MKPERCGSVNAGAGRKKLRGAGLLLCHNLKGLWLLLEDIDVCPVTLLLLNAFFKLVSGNPQSIARLSTCNFVRFLG